MTCITLSPQQATAFGLIMHWFKSDKQTFALAGFAGTGKSTLAKMIAEECGSTAYLAYTGKAANVLREKGCELVSTIHAAIYEYLGVDDYNNPVFGQSNFPTLSSLDLVIVDEYSMLPDDIILDLEMSGAKKILYLGDPFQLPPVKGECSIKADFFLTEIHRQALDSPILRYATKVRVGETFSFVDEGGFIFMPYRNTTRELYLGAEQVICGKNATRHDYNRRFRKFLGLESDLPLQGDKMICLKNNKKKRLFNGLIGTATENATRGDSQITFKLDFEGWHNLVCWDGDLKGDTPPRDLPYHWNRFDYGYAITAHKSQGSEWLNGVVLNEPVGSGEAARRWLYTALTRFAEKVTLVQP